VKTDPWVIEPNFGVLDALGKKAKQHNEFVKGRE
jgi:hypothetical protein